MMKIKNTGRRRLRIGRTLYIGPGEIVDLEDSDGEWFLLVHGDLIDITPKKRGRPAKIEPKVEIKVEPKVEKDNDNIDNEVKLDGIE